MTCQRPTKKAYFQDNVKLNTFMHETYPAIVKQAQKEDAVIFWGDETGINNQAYHIRGFAPKGQIPTIPSFSKIEKINMISAIKVNRIFHSYNRSMFIICLPFFQFVLYINYKIIKIKPLLKIIIKLYII